MKKIPLLKGFWIALGSICLVLGTIGIAVPVLPTVPFILRRCFVTQKVPDGCMTGLPAQSCTTGTWRALQKARE